MSEAAALEPSAYSPGDLDRTLTAIAEGLRAGRLVAYVGPGILPRGAAPTLPEEIAAELHKRAPAPGRIRTNMWSVAQFIEQRRHRKTLIKFMSEIFGAPVAPTELHRKLAALRTPLIVDVWYDGAMRAALADRADWVEIQGITRALEHGDVWFKAYDCAGAPAPLEAANAARTLLYKPHGGVTPAQNYLVADSDYVEVLTEIDIQTPIPDAVKLIRETRGFVFLGCRFHDQMLRTYARQIIKRSAGPHYALVDRAVLTKNEIKFFDEIGAILVEAPLDLLAERL
ncbi:MAG: SIR2 family protein [Rhodoblastus sp.]